MTIPLALAMFMILTIPEFSRVTDMTKKVPVDHGFVVRLFDLKGRPAGSRWFDAPRPGRRTPNLIEFLSHPDPYLHVASVRPIKRSQRRSYGIS